MNKLNENCHQPFALPTLNEKEYEWLRTEMKRCIAVNDAILEENDPHNEELEDAYGIKTGIEYVFWLMDVGIYQPGTQGRSPGPLYIEMEEE